MNFRNITLWVFIALIVFGLFNLFSNTSGERNIIDLTYSQFLDEVEAGSVKDVVIRGSNINVHLMTAGHLRLMPQMTLRLWTG